MEKLYIGNWFKAPSKKDANKLYVVKKQKRGAGRKNGKSRKKIKK